MQTSCEYLNHALKEARKGLKGGELETTFRKCENSECPLRAYVALKPRGHEDPNIAMGLWGGVHLFTIFAHIIERAFNRYDWWINRPAGDRSAPCGLEERDYQPASRLK